METKDEPKTKKEVLDELDDLIGEVDKLQEAYERAKVNPPKTTTFKVNVKTVSDGEIKTIKP